MLGEKLKEFREAKGLLQRQVAVELDVDTAYISKMENNDKPVSRNNLVKLARLFDIKEELLFTYWLAEKVFDILKNEEMGLKAIAIAEEELKTKKKNR
jgi:transcriptional regulator with XRE-family HTH domain